MELRTRNEKQTTGLTTAALIKKKETEIDEASVERKKHIEKANSLK
eukprot:SAG11_NODE_39272_length_237_cov_1.072464_1_plen_45_part_01